MGRDTVQQTPPDLFAGTSARETPSSSANPTSSPNTIADGAATPYQPRHVLPTDLAGAIKQLEDQELDRLLAAVQAEQKRRGGKLPAPGESSGKGRVEAVPVRLTQGKVNAVRAAFKAGVTPSRIARQFGISQADVRNALVSGDAKR
jgi:hypothetical protein